MFNQLQDNALITVHPSALLDMALGGNIRRKRRNFEEFKAKIKAQGIIQPVVARPIKGNETQLELLGGYGRRDAALALGLDGVPVLIRAVDDQTALEIHLAENQDREGVTIVDEVEFARRYISLHHGDRQSAAQALGWEVSKLSSRLELLTCTPDVLDALDDGKIKAGHALTLCVFNETIQNNTLAKIIKENWSVKETKTKANQVQIPLSLAKFDLSECNACPFNSQRQSGLFDNGDVDAKCSNNTCFKKKNTEYMEVQRSEAEERFGKVLMLSETNKADRRTVSAAVVGDAQYNESCEACTDRVAIMDDTITGSAGRIAESQCINLKCFSTCFKANHAAMNAKSIADNQIEVNDITEKVTNVTSESAVKAGDDNASKKPVEVGKISKPAIEAHVGELRYISGELIKDNKKFALALQVVSLMKFTSFTLIANIDTSVAKLMCKSEKELTEMIDGIIQFAATKSTSFGGGDITGASKLLTHCACAEPTGLGDIVAQWKPTIDVLENYTTSQLISVCKLSGFAGAMEEKEPTSFAKASKGKKGDLIKVIMGTPFDWSNYAPTGYQNLLPKHK